MNKNSFIALALVVALMGFTINTAVAEDPPAVQQNTEVAQATGGESTESTPAPTKDLATKKRELAAGSAELSARLDAALTKLQAAFEQLDEAVEEIDAFAGDVSALATDVKKHRAALATARAAQTKIGTDLDTVITDQQKAQEQVDALQDEIKGLLNTDVATDEAAETDTTEATAAPETTEEKE